MKWFDLFKGAGGILAKLKGVSAVKFTAIATSVAVAAGSVGAGGYIMYDYENIPQEMETARVIEVAQVEEEPEPVEEPEMEEEELPEEEPEEEEPEEQEEPEEEVIELSLTGTSIEKDLKIRIQNQKSKLVTGVPFVISVKSTKTGAKTSTYEDKDKDGIIYINKIEAGKYTVELQAVEGYTLKNAVITVEVKDKIEYKKVDVAAEIKTESQINTAVEDTAVNNVPVESTVKDTLPLLESKSSASQVAKGDVSVPGTAKASASGSQSASMTRKVVQTSVVTPPVQEEPKPEEPKPTTPEEPKPEEPKPTTPEEPKPEEPKPTTPEEPKPEEPKPTTPEGPKPEEGDANQNGTESNPDGTNPPADNTGEGSGAEGGAASDPSGDSAAPNAAETASVRMPFKASAAVGSRTGLMLMAAPSQAVSEQQATVSGMPDSVTLYNSSDSESNSYKITLSVDDKDSIIKSIAWSCNHTAIELSPDGYSATLTRKSVGSDEVKAVITYAESVTDGNETTAVKELKCAVSVADPDNASEALKDKSGNALYVDEKAQTEATVKDYDSHDTFYTAPQYTGWQTLNGKVYYYNENHQAVTGNQVIGGVSYSFAADGSLSQSSGNKGIDVSKYQGNIDWGAVAASGINFAIIRVGYRGSSTGVLVEDPYFKRNISGATKAGIKVGVYFFTQAVTEAEAVEEASMAMSLVSGYRLTYPIFIDTESASNGRANGLSRSARTAVVRAFCQTVQSGGYKAGVYASKSWFNNQLNASSLSSYCIWVAQYSSSCTYSGKHDMWQHTSKGSVSGIKGNVDMNISYTGY